MVCDPNGDRVTVGHSESRCQALALRARQPDSALGAEDVAVQVGDPLAPAGGHVQVAYLGLDMRGYAVPVELRIAIDDIGRGIVAQLTVDADLFELMVERVGLAQIV